MRTVRWLAWSVGILFLLGTALQAIDLLNLYATPPDLSSPLNMVEERLAIQDYRIAIWPIFFLNNLAFAVAFGALVGLGLALASWLPDRDPRRVAILTSLGVGGVLGVVAQLILLGATQVTIDITYCDCGFKESEIVAQIWAQMLANGASNMLVNGALLMAGLGVLAVNSAFGARMPAAWNIVSWLTAIASIASVVLGVLHLGNELGLYLLLAVSGVLVPIWTLWLGASLPDWAVRAETEGAEAGT